MFVYALLTFDSLLECGSDFCSFNLDDVNILNLKITPMIPGPPPVFHHQVPIFVCSAGDVEATKVDLTLQQVRWYLLWMLVILSLSIACFRLFLTSMASIIS